jgi:colanic acid biosynthesis glycosyl transferase WcaI
MLDRTRGGDSLRILVHGINFAPELTGIGKYTGEMVEWLAGRGHTVRVVTTPPYYPQWNIQPGFSACRYRREVRGGATVWRCPLWVPGARSGPKRLLHLASFAASSKPVMLGHAAWRPDVVMAIAPALMSAPVAWMTARLCGARAWLHIQDFEVDTAFDLGLLESPHARGAALALERWLLRRFDRVSAISPRMVERLGAKGVQSERQLLLPNWVDVTEISPLAASPYRADMGLASDTVVALYSGNMGEKQGIELLVDAARALAPLSHIVFVLCGDGAARARLESAAQGLTNIRWLPLQPAERLNDLLNLADIHLLPQRADVADLVMPSKLTGMLASGRPVVTTAAPGTQVAAVVADAGLVVPPGDREAFAEAITRLAANPELRARLGRAGREYALQHLDRDAVLGRLEASLLALASRKPRSATVPVPGAQP